MITTKALVDFMVKWLNSSALARGHGNVTRNNLKQTTGNLWATHEENNPSCG